MYWYDLSVIISLPKKSKEQLILASKLTTTTGWHKDQTQALLPLYSTLARVSIQCHPPAIKFNSVTLCQKGNPNVL